VPTEVEEVEHRGIRWRRPGPKGPIEFLDPNKASWVEWAPGVDAPPRPPGWEPAQAPAYGAAGQGRPPRPGWRTPWRLVPLAVTLLVLVVAVVQVFNPSANNVKQEAATTAALLGKCLAQSGTAEGHPKYSANPVPCTSPTAAVKVVQVLASTPGSPACEPGTTGFERPYQGVQYPHILCLKPLR
jgi:hypothetical protein